VTQPERRGARALQIGLGVVISAALVWWAFHKTPFSEVWSIIETARVAPMAIAVILATLPFALRVPRWQLLLRHDDGSAISTQSMWNAIAIGFAANNVLPLRAGEFLRVAAINRLAPVSFATALSSVAVERVIDGLVAVTLLGIGLVGGHLQASNGMGDKAVIIGVACLVAILLAILAAWRRADALRLLEWLLPSGPIAGKLVGFVDSVLRGLSAMRDPRRAVPVLLWSVAIWLVNGAAFFVAFKAFGFDVPFTGALVVQGAAMIGIAVPSTPGFVGVLETAIYGALLLYGVDQPHGLAYGMLYHVTTFIPITLMGAIAAVKTGTQLRTPL
jgi:uncharacterized protein (TIRG00374 family)